jgi:hypothetical protein
MDKVIEKKKVRTIVHILLRYYISMGRRAKNKQAAPVPFSETKENGSHPSPRNLGKRKAGADVPETSRPVKKIKEIEPKGTGKLGIKIAGKVKDMAKSVEKPGKPKVRERKVTSSGELSDGWENVGEEVDLKAHAK